MTRPWFCHSCGTELRFEGEFDDCYPAIRDELAEIIRVVVNANETEEGAIGLVDARLDKRHADLLRTVLRETGTRS